MVQYESLLKGALPATIWLVVLSIILASITAAYAIIGDFMMGKWTFLDPNNTAAVLSGGPIKMIEHTAPSTDATIVSACVGLIAGITAIVSWFMLRRRNMDHEVNMPRRRFYVGVVLLSTLATFCSALAALILHFTQNGPDEFGCTVTSDGKKGNIFYCTREVSACKVVPAWRDEALKSILGDDKDSLDSIKKNPWTSDRVCGMVVAVKWMQLLLMLTALAVGGLFLAQAIIRHKNRYERMELLNKGKEGARDDPSFDGRF